MAQRNAVAVAPAPVARAPAQARPAVVPPAPVARAAAKAPPAPPTRQPPSKDDIVPYNPGAPVFAEGFRYWIIQQGYTSFNISWTRVGYRGHIIPCNLCVSNVRLQADGSYELGYVAYRQTNFGKEGEPAVMFNEPPTYHPDRRVVRDGWMRAPGRQQLTYPFSQVFAHAQ